MINIKAIKKRFLNKYFKSKYLLKWIKNNKHLVTIDNVF